MLKEYKPLAKPNIILYQCYSGWSPSELGQIEVCDYDPINETIKAGSKTKAGKNRIVPIHPFVQNIIKKHYKIAKQMNREFLFSYRGKPLEYHRILTMHKHVIKECGLNSEHRMHDGRVRFITTAKKYHVDEYVLKLLVGHNINDITEHVYTKRDLNDLRTEIEKIK